MGSGLDVDFKLIFIDFECQVGVENQVKIGWTGDRKSDGKTVAAKIGQKLKFGFQTVRETPGHGRREVPPSLAG